ncbi:MULTISPECIES: glycosyl hydrolase family 2 [Acidobacterium]|uniref:Glycosyl hydrolase, family 2 n=1 Tax=Acidobacterium capsulatum (strain ATCC 51196 / DSM 11244 / BCRC 80197 / JCM 7670 / NBRC 15755 / NCIMB 13165 / 161) TaxID=240015 RepID=C1F592_ACIC5|nr:MULTISPECIES: glycosyl hydrolase family 2 [Acidobacterium]ACO31871.1 glycosyl hydrolase, family 2 [Acidobacterium capsulatum ATCC 51196]HCT59556.1 glycosyl hydrolase family 2 [Acidobacterium sp.]
MNRSRLCSLLAALMMAPLLHASQVTPLHDGWRIQSACKLSAGGETISRADYSPQGWITATIPSTVLAAQVAAGVFPDPYFGDNLRKLPGMTYPVGENFENLPMSPSSPYHCGWWYRDTVIAPAANAHGQQWLHFGGINYRADIWVNGHKVADSSQIAGAYRTYDLNVTPEWKPGQTNVIAVEVFAPTHKDLGINWVDWNPDPPDRDMGLWGAVKLISTGPVALRSPMVATHFHDGDLNEAELTVEAELQNTTDHPLPVTVSGGAAGAQFTQDLTLAPHATQAVLFTPQKFPQLTIHHPKLWWPRQMGTPHLEDLTMTVRAQGKVSDQKSIPFGIREITSELTAGGARLFRVNGKPILIRGGGWSQDMLLRRDPVRLRKQFQLVRALNLNTIRLEGKMESNDFFHLADKDGILVMAGWCCCDHWEHWKNWTPTDLQVATASLHSQMLRLRSHPSLLAWLNGSDNAPPANVETAYLNVEAETHWPNPVLSAASSQDTTVTGLNGVKMTGPYDYVEPSYWYVDERHGGDYGFNTETSPGPAIPSLASRKKFLPDPQAWPPSADWSLHYGGGGFKNLAALDNAMNAIYAKPTNLADYTRMAATMEYDSERAMFESYSGNKFVSTGVIQWMLNNAWPSMIWHLYDYNLDPDAGYYAVKKACEPLHIQYSYNNQGILVVNSTYHYVSGLTANVEVHDVHWNELYSATAKVDAASNSSQRVFTLPEKLFNGMTRIFLINLKLTDANGHVVSRNFYWVPYTLTTFAWDATDYTHTPAARYPDLRALTGLPQASVSSHAEIVRTAQGREIRLHLDNTSGHLAFQVRAEALTPSGDLIAPVIWSDDWIELMPGESRTLTASLPKDAPADTVVKLSGWNIASTTLTPAAGSDTAARK